MIFTTDAWKSENMNFIDLGLFICDCVGLCSELLVNCEHVKNLLIWNSLNGSGPIQIWEERVVERVVEVLLSLFNLIYSVLLSSY